MREEVVLTVIILLILSFLASLLFPPEKECNSIENTSMQYLVEGECYVFKDLRFMTMRNVTLVDIDYLGG